jgi:hypothetical protein
LWEILMTTTVTAAAARVNTHVMPVAMLSAAPELRTSVRPSTSPTTAVRSPAVSADSAHALVT